MRDSYPRIMLIASSLDLVMFAYEEHLAASLATRHFCHWLCRPNPVPFRRNAIFYDTHLFPALRPSAVLVLHQQVGCPNFPLIHTITIRPNRRGAMVLRHVNLQLFGVRPGRRLPAGFLGRRVEVVGEVLRVGVAHLPVGW